MKALTIGDFNCFSWYVFNQFKWKIWCFCTPYFKNYMDKFFVSWVATIFLFSITKIRETVFTKKFEKYPTTQIIIGGNKIFVERAISMKTEAQTWSNYKHHNTWKALVNISLNNIVNFVSPLWTGWVSQRELTKCPGLLEKVEPGDNMVDMGIFCLLESLLIFHFSKEEETN